MFEFFIALFGGIYIISRLTSERRKSREADSQMQNWISEMNHDLEEWLQRVVDIKLEYEVRNKRFSKEATDMMHRIIDESGVSTMSTDMIVMGMLAQKGKIPRSIAEYGIRSRGVWDYAEQLRWKDQRLFMLWYDKELRRNGLKEPLLFVDGVNEREVCHNIYIYSKSGYRYISCNRWEIFLEANEKAYILIFINVVW